MALREPDPGRGDGEENCEDIEAYVKAIGQA